MKNNKTMKNIFYTFLMFGMIVLIPVSCGKKTEYSEQDLKTKRKIIKKQIDSLKRELIKIDLKLKDTSDQDLPSIAVDTVKIDTFAYYIDLQGVVKSDGNVNIVPLFQGEVLKIYKKPGDRVMKGEIIMRLDDKILRNQISEVRTQYQLAKTTYERQKRLWEQKIGSEMAYLQARTKYLSLQKKLRTLNEQLKRAKITSPINGTLDELMIKEGETALPGRPVARVVNLKEVYVEADASEKYLKDFQKNKPVMLYFPEAGKKLSARIDYVGNFIHPNNRTFKIRINIKNKDQLLKPNLTAQIKIQSQKIDSAVVIPVSLVQEDAQGQEFVYILDSLKIDNQGKTIYQVKKQPVETGLTYNKKAWIKKGLQGGELLALSGAYGLTEGDKVLIKTEENE